MAEALNQAVQDPQEVAAAVVAVDMDGATAKAILPPALEGTELGEAVAEQSAAIAQAAVQQQEEDGAEKAANGLDLSRKRSAAHAMDEEQQPGDEPRAAEAAAAEHKRRRKFLRGMEVVWKFFGVDNQTA